MTSNSMPEPKTAPTGASAAESRASSDAQQAESTSKSAGKAKGGKKSKKERLSKFDKSRDQGELAAGRVGNRRDQIDDRGRAVELAAPVIRQGDGSETLVGRDHRVLDGLHPLDDDRTVPDRTHPLDIGPRQ